MTEAWRIALCEPQRERLAAGHLLRVGIPSYLPVILKRSSAGRGFQREIQRAMFPSYLFVKFSLDMPGWTRLFATPGIRGCGQPLGERHGLLMEGSRFAEVAEDKIEAISLTERQLAGEKNPIAKDMGLEIGQECRLRLNPWTDILCRIEDLTADQRIGVLFRLLGREVHSYVNVAQIAS